MKFFLWGSSYRCYKMYGHVLHPTSKPTLVFNLMDEKNAQTPPTIGLTTLSSHHHPSNPIATEKSRTASLRLDLPVCTLVIQYSQTFQQGTLLCSTSPTHAGTRVCVRRKWRQAQAQTQHRTGAGLLPLLPRWACLRKISSTGQVVHFLFSFFLSQHEFDFFRYYDARR